ncbi:MAG TPA: cell wall hydrolase [Sphingomonas sp.]|nr:cell wall hydrolase [Sphingomonas sp.]
MPDRSHRFVVIRRAAVAGGCVLVGVGIVATWLPRSPRPSPPRIERAVPVAVKTPSSIPDVAPLEYRPITVEEALKINTDPRVPEDAGPAARAFATALVKPAALDCLTNAVYYEAASESDDGERAVAQVVLNRVRHPAFPATVCGVVYQGAERTTGCQFTFTCDGALLRTPSAAGWARAQRVARAALKGYVFAPVGNATHYHANFVVPYWASSLDRAATIGAHIFYRWAGSWGRPPAFYQRYAGIEPDISAAIARWKSPAPSSAVLLPPPVLLEDAKVLSSRPLFPTKPIVLAADRESGGLVSSLRKKPRLEADRRKPRLKADPR